MIGVERYLRRLRARVQVITVAHRLQTIIDYDKVAPALACALATN